MKPLSWELPKHKAGQCVYLGLYSSAKKCPEATEELTKQAPDEMIKRAYSIASSSSQAYVEFYVNLVHSGALSPRIFALEIGDKIWMSPKPKGIFTLDDIDSEQNIILIATGAGVAPFMSMLRSNALSRKGNLMVVHCAANSWDLAYASELNLLETMFSKFDYYPSILRPEKESSDWNGDTRPIREIWSSAVVEKQWGFKPSPANTHIFLCGHPNMIDTMTETLKKDGFTECQDSHQGQIHVERF